MGGGAGAADAAADADALAVTVAVAVAPAGPPEDPLQAASRARTAGTASSRPSRAGPGAGDADVPAGITWLHQAAGPALGQRMGAPGQRSGMK
jgi:hypothetical protein